MIHFLAKVLPNEESRVTLKGLFESAGAPGDPPQGTKAEITRAWLKRINQVNSPDPLKTLGLILESLLDPTLDPQELGYEEQRDLRQRIDKFLARDDLEYRAGGQIVSTVAVGSPSRSLQELIRDRDLGAVHEEFDRALETVDAKPREAISAASNILESVCKVYIEDAGHLTMPKKMDLTPVWNIVRKDLGFEPSSVEDRDLQKILTGLISIVDGVAALRTHASTAHSPGRRGYRPQPRHARLSVHAAHTVAGFILESWDQKTSQ